MTEMETEVQAARRELEQQREFLLQNKWQTRSPDTNAWVQHINVGCLVERAYCSGDKVKGWAVAVEGIWTEMANRAITWTLVEMGYAPKRQCPHTYENAEDHRDFNIACNDHLFTQAGEAIEVLERSLLNLKQAFGEETG